MSERKTIQVNPELFNYSSSNKTRKKREPSSQNHDKIKIKSPPRNSRNDTLKKRSLLKMIRAHQEEKYRKMFQEQNEKKEKNPLETTDAKFNSEFEQSKEYLNKLLEENTIKTKLNTTVRNYPTQTNSLLYTQDIENIQTELPNVFQEKIMENYNTVPIKLQPRPQYGCLKGGTLPTYRNWVNKTVKNQSSFQPSNIQSTSTGLFQQPTYIVSNNSPSIGPNSLNQTIMEEKNPLIREHPIISPMNLGGNIEETKIDNHIKRMSEITQTMAKLNALKSQNIQKRKRQKKTVRRTYKIGKSKILPKISVLVSNRTIRNKISTEKQLLNQVPIQEIKKYLIKRGLIKVGSIAPNEILRKMYESSILICGEVQNHNPDNLLYNFINGDDK
jgi:hypothetical protein